MAYGALHLRTDAGGATCRAPSGARQRRLVSGIKYHVSV
jgi:hypothetical protein